MDKLITKSFKRLLDKGLHRGFITHEELAKSLGKRHYSQENIEKAFFYIFDNKVSLVEKKSDYKPNKKRESSSGENEKGSELDKSDDPIRMYLREMGGVELLSREGEIAIAKRIEAGKSVMISALFVSPITGRKVFEWKDKLEKGELLVREIIDIDSTYVDAEADVDESSSQKSKAVKKIPTNKSEKSDNDLKEGEEQTAEYSEEDEFNLSLAKMEEEIKPQIISTIDILSKNYLKLMKCQNEKLECALNATDYSRSKENRYKSIQTDIIEKIKTLQINPSVLEDLVQDHYQESKKIISLDGLLMRSAMDNKISREEFLKYYLGNEINANFQSFLSGNTTWKNFFKKKKKEFTEIRERLIEISKKIGLPVGEFRKLLNKIKKVKENQELLKKKW